MGLWHGLIEYALYGAVLRHGSELLVLPLTAYVENTYPFEFGGAF